MGAHLITGYAGKEHITSEDQGLFNAGAVGTGKYVLPVGSKFSYQIVTNNLIKIRDGVLVNQGRQINIAVNDYEELEIDNGLQALKRNDLIVMRYQKNTDTGIESASLIVIKGVSGETAVDPSYITGNIINGDTADDFPLYRVKVNGLNIEKVEKMYKEIPSIDTLFSNLNPTNINNAMYAVKYAKQLSNGKKSYTADDFALLVGGTGNTGQTGEALRLLGLSEANCVYGNYNFGIYFIMGTEEGLPLTGYHGFLITLRWTTSRIIKILFFTNGYTYVCSQENDGTVVIGWVKQ